MSRRLALVICFLAGLVMFLQYFSEHPMARTANQTILEYWQIIFAFALMVGIVGFVRSNMEQVKRKEGTVYRLVALGGFAIMPIMAIIWGIKIDTPFMWTFENIQVPMQATVFALLAFFVASASFRGFRARSLPAAVLLVSASLLLLSRSPVGEMFEWLPQTADWIRNYPSMAARRAILIGIGLGSLTTSLRVILGIERTWLGGSK